MDSKRPPQFLGSQVGLMTNGIPRMVRFYERLGFRETFRSPKEGEPDHVEVRLGEQVLGISSAAAARSRHGLNPDLGGRPAYVVVWTTDTDAAYARCVQDGATTLSPPNDFPPGIRSAWIADPDGNPVNLAQRRS
jgi:catechol 2,3-dioxygenase-like lactoylglutathione lyase family enzyme